jgi:hypothetical protein
MQEALRIYQAHSDVQRLHARNPWVPWLFPPAVLATWWALSLATESLAGSVPPVLWLVDGSTGLALWLVGCLLMATTTHALYCLPWVPTPVLYLALCLALALVHSVLVGMFHYGGRVWGVVCGAPNTVMLLYLVYGVGSRMCPVPLRSPSVKGINPGQRTLRRDLWQVCSRYMPVLLPPRCRDLAATAEAPVPQISVLFVLALSE